MRGLDRLFEVHATAGSVEFPGVTLRDGYSDDHGGAILNARSGAVVVSESALERNVAGKTGGGIDNHGEGTVHVAGSQLTANCTGSGSALNNNAGGSLTVDWSTVSGNGDPTDLQGGGAIDNASGTVTVAESTITGNSGKTGAVRIPRHWLRVRRGVATIKLACPGPGQVCAGRIALRVPTAARAASASRWLVLGSTRYRIRGGDTTRVRVRLSERRWARVRRRRGVRVQAVITARGSAVRATVALRVRSGGS